MLHATFPAGETCSFPPDIGAAEARKAWIDAPLACFVAEEDGRLPGTCFIRPNQPGLGAHVCNCGYLVAAEARGRGVQVVGRLTGALRHARPGLVDALVMFKTLARRDPLREFPGNRLSSAAMSQKKPVMGRGLEALLGQMTRRPEQPAAGAPAAAEPSAKLPGDELANLPLDLLQRGKYQPRVDMRQESLQELADSIKAQGIVQPIVVRPVEGAAPGSSQRYEIIAGERRWRAAQLAGLATVPAVIRRVADEAAIAMALIENIQRENLNPLEEARALDRLISEFGITHQQAADAVGRSRAAVSNLLRLLELPPEISAFVEKRELEMGHARALLGLTQRRHQVEVGQLVAKKGLSVRETEALVRSMLSKAAGGGPGKDGAKPLDPNVQRLQDELSEKLGAPVQIQHSGSGRGKVVVSYHSLDELDGILAHIR